MQDKQEDNVNNNGFIYSLATASAADDVDRRFWNFLGLTILWMFNKMLPTSLHSHPMCLHIFMSNQPPPVSTHSASTCICSLTLHMYLPTHPPHVSAHSPSTCVCPLTLHMYQSIHQDPLAANKHEAGLNENWRWRHPALGICEAYHWECWDVCIVKGFVLTGLVKYWSTNQPTEMMDELNDVRSLWLGPTWCSTSENKRFLVQSQTLCTEAVNKWVT